MKKRGLQGEGEFKRGKRGVKLQNFLDNASIKEKIPFLLFLSPIFLKITKNFIIFLI